MSVNWDVLFKPVKGQPVDVAELEKYFFYYFGKSTVGETSQQNVVRSIFMQYLNYPWEFSRGVYLDKRFDISYQTCDEYRCCLNDCCEVTLTEWHNYFEKKGPVRGLKKACIEIFSKLNSELNDDVNQKKDNDDLINYISIDFDDSFSDEKYMSDLKNLSVICRKLKKISIDDYQLVELLYFYSICADEKGNLYVEVKLRNEIIGTIKIDEFISSILNNEYNKIFNCSFKSFEKSASPKITNR